MGTWASGPFDNDSAADFLIDAEVSPARAVTRALLAVTKAPAGAYLDVDDGAPAWAACELVAISFGRGDGELADDVLEIAHQLRPDEKQVPVRPAASEIPMDADLNPVLGAAPTRSVLLVPGAAWRAARARLRHAHGRGQAAREALSD